MKKTVLLTGGLGFIGSHTAVELLKKDYDVVIVDDLSNSTTDVIDKIYEITGKTMNFYQGDVAEKFTLSNVFTNNKIDAVIHFAGYKAVGESVQKPIMYYRNNLDTTLNLLEKMSEYKINNIIFSSSATVYGEENVSPLDEEMKTFGCTNPYGWTKYMGEQILKDVSKVKADISTVILRYFNPVGGHESGILGENPNGVPNNLMPYITQTAAGIRAELSIFGDDYNTPDGTGVRDYIHVVDLAKGHVAALEYSLKNTGCEVFNLGTGVGYSVLDVVNTFSRVNNVDVPYKMSPRRSGDIATCYSNSNKAKEILGWTAEKGIDDMCRDAWQSQRSM